MFQVSYVTRRQRYSSHGSCLGPSRARNVALESSLLEFRMMSKREPHTAASPCWGHSAWSTWCLLCSPWKTAIVYSLCARDILPALTLLALQRASEMGKVIGVHYLRQGLGLESLSVVFAWCQVGTRPISVIPL